MSKKKDFDFESFIKLLELLGEFDDSDLDFYYVRTEDGKLYIDINDSDLFAWGFASSYPISPEDLDELRQCFIETQEIESVVGTVYAPYLFVSRRTKSRPQGAMYPEERELWPLFDACGPEREVGFGNPYTPEEYHKKRKDAYQSGSTARDFEIDTKNEVSDMENQRDDPNVS